MVGVAVRVLEVVKVVKVVCELVDMVDILKGVVDVVDIEVPDAVEGAEEVSADVEMIELEVMVVGTGCVAGSPMYCRPRSLMIPAGLISAVRLLTLLGSTAIAPNHA